MVSVLILVIERNERGKVQGSSTSSESNPRTGTLPGHKREREFRTH